MLFTVQISKWNKDIEDTLISLIAGGNAEDMEATILWNIVGEYNEYGGRNKFKLFDTNNFQQMNANLTSCLKIMIYLDYHMFWECLLW